jgi:hypothetical protein
MAREVRLADRGEKRRGLAKAAAASAARQIMPTRKVCHPSSGDPYARGTTFTTLIQWHLYTTGSAMVGPALQASVGERKEDPALQASVGEREEDAALPVSWWRWTPVIQRVRR